MEGSAPGVRSAGARLVSIDVLRGIVIALMALDHTRDFFATIPADPTDLSTASAGWFLTRWVTHLCAPVFLLLAGMGAWLSMERMGRAGLARFLVVRGLVLIALEFTVVRFEWYLWREPWIVFGAVLWAIGCSMIVLAGLVYLPRWAVAVLAVAMIAGHNLAGPVDAWATLHIAAPGIDGVAARGWTILHIGNVMVPIVGGVWFYVRYPLVPWIGVMAAGLAMGPVMRMEPRRRRAWCLVLGGGMAAAFVVLRGARIYGDPHGWSAGAGSAARSALELVNCEKYPPSLLFLLMTLGPAVAALPWLERARGRWPGVLAVLGRVPLFFYVVHFLPLHAAAGGLALARFGWAEVSSWSRSHKPPAGYTLGLWLVYVAWIMCLFVMYPACRWYAGVRSRGRAWWLRIL